LSYKNSNMKALLFSLFISFLTVSCARVESRPSDTPVVMNAPSFYDFTLKSIDGQEVPFSQFKGKKVLLVNTASECGYTPQYEGLQELHKKYGDKVTVIGFPANDFGGQEPGSNNEIKGFCSKNYGVTFLMMEKISVKGDSMHPLYKWLSTRSLNGWNEEAPSWNFCKYLINEEGKLIKFYNSSVKPMSDEIVKTINA
jgi:glutathione peroxidase